MKPLVRHLAIAIFLCLGSGAIAQLVEPEILIEFDFSGPNCTQCGDDGIIGLGLDTNGSDAYDDTLDIPAPPAGPGSLFGKVILNSDVILTGFTLDVRELGADNITWELSIDNGLPSQDITATWTAQDFIDLGTEGYISAELRSSDGSTLLADLMTASSHVFTGAGTTALIVIKQSTNAAPVANDDTETVFSNDSPVSIDVLDNDKDADGDPRTITQVTQIDDGQGAEGTVTINGASDALDYVPPASNLFDANTIDTFTYTISDGTDTATATVTVTIFSDDLVATRSHAELSKAGETEEDGLVVTVSLQFSDALRDNKESITTLEVEEYLPPDDFPVGNYYVASGSGFDGFDIGGVQPTLVQGNTGSTVVFTFDANDIDANGLLEFTYRLVGPDTDRGPVKVIDGEVTYDQGPGEVDVTIPQTQFAAVEALFHNADYKGDTGKGNFSIDADELFDVIVLFNAGLYHIDTNENSKFGPGDGAQTGSVHAADYKGGGGGSDEPDFRIDADELFDVIVLFNAGSYHVDTNENSGYGPGDAP